MSVEILREDNIIIAKISGDIDHHTAKNIREYIDNEVEKNKPSLLKIDFKNVDFMDSSGIGLIMGRYKLMNAIDGELKIINVPPYISRVIRLSGLEQLGVLEKKKRM